MGYETFTYKLRADEFGMVKTCERVFVISILNPNIKRNKDQIQKMINKQKKALSKQDVVIEVNKIIKIESSKNKLIEEFELLVPNNTKSRIKMARKNKNLSIKGITKIDTLTTK